jgi:cephalosporin hydroxylase
MAEYRATRELSESEIKEELVKCFDQLVAKIREQKGIPTFFDNGLMRDLRAKPTFWRALLRKVLGARALQERTHFLRRMVRTWVDKVSAPERNSGAVDSVLARHLGPDANSIRELPRKFFGLGPLNAKGVALRRMLNRRSMGRFVDYFERKSMPAEERNHLELSQGVDECVRWKGYMLFKTVYDLVIYQLILAELRPGTIIEIGSGDGGSAIWFADQARILGIETRVVSMDNRPPAIEYPSVRFLAGDCNQIGSAFTEGQLAQMVHPWLVVEDAHVNLLGVLEFFDNHLQSGDYFVVEDSPIKENDIGKFMLTRSALYPVDTRFTDFFGQNATCSVDSIFKRM